MPPPQPLEGFFPTCATTHGNQLHEGLKLGKRLYSKNSSVIQPGSFAEYVFSTQGGSGNHKHLTWSSLSTPRRRRSSRVKWANCTPSIRAWLNSAQGLRGSLEKFSGVRQLQAFLQPRRHVFYSPVDNGCHPRYVRSTPNCGKKKKKKHTHTSKAQSQCVSTLPAWVASMADKLFPANGTFALTRFVHDKALRIYLGQPPPEMSPAYKSISNDGRTAIREGEWGVWKRNEEDKSNTAVFAIVPGSQLSNMQMGTPSCGTQRSLRIVKGLLRVDGPKLSHLDYFGFFLFVSY